MEHHTHDSGVITSPATSTPGSTPGSNKRGKLINSELQNSEESIIGSSILEDERKDDTVEDDEIVIIKMADHTLTGKSVEEKESLGVDDTAWETILEESDNRGG